MTDLEFHYVLDCPCGSRLTADTEDEIVEVSFREQHPPDIQTGIDACVRQGARRVLLYPYFLFAGAHVLEDLPAEMEEARCRHPGLELAMGDHLGTHAKLAEIVDERVAEALTRSGWAS